MCLILRRPPKVRPDFEQFKTAILNNPDGWGMSAAMGDGTLTTFRNQEKPDPEKLFRFSMEEWGELPVLLHLRYTTAGATSLRNAHPFPILEKSVDGVDLRMAHNGTLHMYKPKTGDESDTRMFVKNFVRPLFKRLIRGIDSKEILTDPFVYSLLDSELSHMSVLSFIDGYGNSLEVNAKGNGGDYTERGIYYSNKYSFDPDHRLPKKYGVVGTVGQNGKAGSNITTVPTTNKTALGSTHAKDTKVMKFSQKYDFADVTELLDVTDDLIDVMVDEHPEDAKLLIKELLFELYREIEGEE